MRLSIDPGDDTGWALFDSDKLVACGLGDPSCNPYVQSIATSGQLESVTVERPAINRATKRPEDIITLALNAGQWTGVFRACCPVEFVDVVRWKSGVPKEKHQPRIKDALRPDERHMLDAMLAAFSVARGHNIVDAVGIGLFVVGRRVR